MLLGRDGGREAPFAVANVGGGRDGGAHEARALLVLEPCGEAMRQTVPELKPALRIVLSQWALTEYQENGACQDGEVRKPETSARPS
jgi:hypothetical protein